jgi:3-oxoacyl-[acyl-carrier protein] reductase
VTINNLLPGFFMTERNRVTVAAFAKEQCTTEQEALAQRLKHIPAGRQGDPAEFGDACAYLCSAQASFITAQNLLLDGGAYPGTF